MSVADMLNILQALADEGELRDLDVALARYVLRADPGADACVLLAVALASQQLGQGHLRLPLAEVLAEPARFGLAASVSLQALLTGLDVTAWRRSLLASLAVTATPEVEAAAPLVLDGDQLYLRRAWRDECAVASDLRARMRLPAQQHDGGRLRALLAQLFPRQPDAPPGPDWQQVACALAARQRFTVITGGPGTGKTTTVLRLLALLQSLALAGEGGRPLRIRLAAPTGKAAARLNESVAGAVARLPVDERVRAGIPTEVSTVHRLLGAHGDRRRFRHHAGHPLPLDVLVMDEASMIDLELMAAVLDALPADARLILLGDKDQLASVEAGAVLGDLCERAAEGRYEPMLADWLEDMTGSDLDPWRLPVGEAVEALDQHVVMLRRSHRFAAEQGIGRLALALQSGRAGVPGLLADCAPEVRQVERATLAEGYQPFLATLAQGPGEIADEAAVDAWALDVLAAFDRYRILCAVRQGPDGVAALNAEVEARCLAPGGGVWFAGRPVMVTRNDHGLGLMNGDIGIALPRSEATGGEPRLRVAFRDSREPGRVRWFLPARLPEIETVYAMTVHKSQGSEFERVALVFPQRNAPVMTRELLYTALTRARARFDLLLTDEALWLGAQARRNTRSSGLSGRLRKIT